MGSILSPVLWGRRHGKRLLRGIVLCYKEMLKLSGVPPLAMIFDDSEKDAS